MRIEARVDHREGSHAVSVSTDGTARSLEVPPKTGGSAVNGGEFLCLALATCYCNDVFREARPRGIDVTRVEVEVHAEFGGAGEPARAIRYRASVWARSSVETIRALMLHVDGVAEIQATLRRGQDVVFEPGTAHPLP